MSWDETPNELRYRIREPELFKSDSFRYKNIQGGDKAINLVIGKLKKGGDSMITQAVRFKKKNENNKKGWTMDEAKKWIKNHPNLAKANLFITDDDLSFALYIAFAGEEVSFVRKEGDKWYVYSKEGKKLSSGYPSRKEAVKRLREIEYFKHHG